MKPAKPKLAYRVKIEHDLDWKMPVGSVKVDHNTRYGNPHVVGAAIRSSVPVFTHRVSRLFSHGEWKTGRFTAEQAVAMYRSDLDAIPGEQLRDFLMPLRGRALMCWCNMDVPCHADVLVEYTNRSENERVTIKAEADSKDLPA